MLVDPLLQGCQFMPGAKQRRPLRRGGKRLDRYRQSTQLTKADCEKLIKAAYEAIDEGKPFNRFITLLWERAGIEGCEAVAITGRFITLVRQWAQRHGYKLVWAWVQEWGPVNGAHIHMLLHVPPHLNWQFSLLPRRWARLCLGGRYVSKTVDSKRVRAGWFGCSYESALLHRVHYMLKCAPAELEGYLHMTGCGEQEWGRRGLTYGKRLAVWQRPT